MSLPEGPGSLEGVGDDVEVDANMGSMRYPVSISLPEAQVSRIITCLREAQLRMLREGGKDRGFEAA